MTARGADLLVESVSHRFGATPVVRDASLHVAAGQIHSLLGPSGSGKTTLLRLVAGLERLEQGRILIGGQEVAAPGHHVPPEQRSIGFVFQDYALFPHLNVRDNVLFGMSGRGRREQAAHAEELLESVGMDAFARAMPHTLSGGQQQRVALARALARDPQVMLLDEPFSGLDARLRGDIRELTVRVLRANQVATLLVTHDPAEALQVSDTVSVIRAGRIEQTGSPMEVYFQPASPAVAETFGQANRFAGAVVRGMVASPWGPVAAPEHADQSRVVVFIRPEAIRLHREPAANSVSAVVRRIALRGETCGIELELGSGQIVFAIALPHERWLEGEAVHASAAAHAAIIFRAL